MDLFFYKNYDIVKMLFGGMDVFGFGEKEPQNRIRKADASTQRLRDKRSNLKPFDEKEQWKLIRKFTKIMLR